MTRLRPKEVSGNLNFETCRNGGQAGKLPPSQVDLAVDRAVDLPVDLPVDRGAASREPGCTRLGFRLAWRAGF